MKLIPHLKRFLFLLVFSLVFIACSSDDDNNNNLDPDQDNQENPTDDNPDNTPNTVTIFDLANAVEDLSDLVQALEITKAGLVEALSDNGTFTVFAPTNEAFQDLLTSLDGYDSLDDFDTEEEITLLVDILQYHVITSATLFANDLSDGDEFETLQGESIAISLDNGVFVQDATDDLAQVIDADNEASNGVVHLIDKVLLPQSVLDALLPQISIVDFVVESDGLSNLEDAVIAANLADALNADGPFTLFAPSNEAFGELLSLLDGFDSLADFDTEEELNLLSQILQYHVVAGQALSTDLSAGDELETLQGESLTVIIDGGVFIDDTSDDNAEVTGADNETSNGVVHIIDKVLLPQAVLDILFPPTTVVDVVTDNDNLTLLEQALIQADLIDALNADGPFTIFAPSDDAINALFDLLGDSFNGFEDFTNPLELVLLRQILLHHVVPQNLPSTDLISGTVASLSNGTLEIIASGGTFVIGDASDTDANLVSVDNTADNGVVHIIDKILISQEVADLLADIGIDIDDPSSEAPTIADLVETTDDLEFLEEALRITGLLETLDGEGPFTVFAPSNDTISLLFALIGSTANSIEDFDLDYEIDLLRNVLLYHVVAGRIGSSDLNEGPVATLLGDSFELELDGDGFVIEDATGLDANFIFTDIPASNGVIHVINRILIPESVIETIVDEAEDTVGDLIEIVEENDILRTAILMVGEEFEDIVINGEPFTFFLPTNQAFLDLFDDLDGIDSLVDFNTEAELRLLGNILIYHCVDGVRALSSDLMDGQSITTVQGEHITISLSNGVSVIDQTGVPSNVTSADNQLLNGVIHFVDKVLLPQEVLDQL